ncbi:MAG TPA: permease prefix domain 1-containing protein [Actinomycetota bacterium]|nr:permease prefix domain 1-containing protein [Actinomycetota bacterium]
MAGAGLIPAFLDPAARRVLDGYLVELEAALVGPRQARAAIVAEVADGLTEATTAHERQGLTPADAASAAAAEFGDAQLVAAGLGAELAAQTGRRVGLGLLATGPLVGLTWLGTVLANAAAVGDRPPAGLVLVPLLFAAVLAAAVPAAVVSVLASGRLTRWLPASSRLAPTAAGLAAALCIAGDLVLLLGLLAWTVTLGALAWPLAITAATASAIRLTLAGRAVRRCVVARQLIA